MYSTPHQFAQCVVDDPVALQCCLAGKTGRDDQQAEMPAFARARMPGMQGGIVDDFKAKRFEEGEPFAQQRFDVAQVGNAFLNGLMVTLA